MVKKSEYKRIYKKAKYKAKIKIISEHWVHYESDNVDDARSDANLIAIDFGCVKEVPLEFYVPYFELAKPKNTDNPQVFEEKMYALEILKTTDSPEEVSFFSKLFHEMLGLLTQPFQRA